MAAEYEELTACVSTNAANIAVSLKTRSPAVAFAKSQVPDATKMGVCGFPAGISPRPSTAARITAEAQETTCASFSLQPVGPDGMVDAPRARRRDAGPRNDTPSSAFWSGTVRSTIARPTVPAPGHYQDEALPSAAGSLPIGSTVPRAPAHGHVTNFGKAKRRFAWYGSGDACHAKVGPGTYATQPTRNIAAHRRARARSAIKAPFGVGVGRMERPTVPTVTNSDRVDTPGPGEYEPWDEVAEDSATGRATPLGTAGFGTRSERFPQTDDRAENAAGFTSPGMVALLSHRRWPREVMQAALQVSCATPDLGHTEEFQLQPQPKVQSSFADQRPRFFEDSAESPGPGHYNAPDQFAELVSKGRRTPGLF